MVFHHLPVSWIELLANIGDRNIGDRLLDLCHQSQFIQFFILEQIPMKIKFCCSVNHVELGDFAMVGYQFGAPMYKSERPYEGKEFQTHLFVLLSGRWIPGKGKDVFIHYGMRDYDFNTFDGWFIGPIEDYILGITTPGKNILRQTDVIYQLPVFTHYF